MVAVLRDVPVLILIVLVPQVHGQILFLTNGIVEAVQHFMIGLLINQTSRASLKETTIG